MNNQLYTIPQGKFDSAQKLILNCTHYLENNLDIEYFDFSKIKIETSRILRVGLHEYHNGDLF